jgi:hypothetical protein
MGDTVQSRVTKHKSVFTVWPTNSATSEELASIEKYVSNLRRDGVQVTFSPEDRLQDAASGLKRRSFEKEAIRQADEVLVYYKPKDPDVMFTLGRVFAAEKQITLINTLQETPGKSFDNVLLDLASGKESPEISPVPTSFRNPGGYQVSGYRVYFLGPVREATEEQKKILKISTMLMRAVGASVHRPAENTDQIDSRGIGICKQNGYAIKRAQLIIVLWEPASTGSQFDLGIADQYEKPILVVNSEDLKPTEKDSFQNWLIEASKSTEKLQANLNRAAQTVRRE